MSDLGGGRTIAAIATPPGKGGVALIRVSGGEALSVASRLFRVQSAKPIDELAPRRAYYGEFILDGRAVDDGLMTVFRAPHSYTGEDTVELACHGGIHLQARLLEAAFSLGASPAGPGEFTRRAYLAGKLTLSDVEAVGALLDAENDEQMKLASPAARGLLSGEIKAIADRLLAALASLFAVIDFPDEDLSDDALPLAEVLAEAEAALGRLYAGYRTGRAIRDGVSAVLLGATNVGKSSIYNRLVGRDAAIVTDIPGTTRDALEAKCTLGRVTLRLTDTAGLRETDDPIERIGVARSREALASAELALAVLDPSRPLAPEQREILDLLDEFGGTPIILLNKSDCAPLWGAHDLPRAYPHILSCSAATGSGFEALAALVERLFTDGSLASGESAILFAARQASEVKRAHDAVLKAKEALSLGMPEDAVAAELERAVSALSALDGREVSEATVSAIFSSFCVGK